MEQEDFYRDLVTGNAYKPVVDALAALVLRRDAMLALQDLRELGATPLPTAPHEGPPPGARRRAP